MLNFLAIRLTKNPSLPQIFPFYLKKIANLFERLFFHSILKTPLLENPPHVSIVVLLLLLPDSVGQLVGLDVGGLAGVSTRAAPRVEVVVRVGTTGGVRSLLG